MRNSIRELIPELEQAAQLLDAASEAIVKGDFALAGELLVALNPPEIREYAIGIVGKLRLEVHRKINRPKYPRTLERDLTNQRRLWCGQFIPAKDRNGSDCDYRRRIQLDIATH